MNSESLEPAILLYPKAILYILEKVKYENRTIHLTSQNSESGNHGVTSKHLGKMALVMAEMLVTAFRIHGSQKIAFGWKRRGFKKVELS